MSQVHKPVLLEECAEYLITDTSGFYFDGTLGFGGHAEYFLSKLQQNAIYIGTDVDMNAFQFCKKKFSGDSRVKLFNYNFTRIDVIEKIENTAGFDGVFADLGVSSYQLDNPESGFTYRSDTQLDLRMDKNRSMTAADVVNTLGEKELADVLYKYGEEKKSRLIAKRIVERRRRVRIETTKDLSSIIEEITPHRYIAKSLSRVFQALRIYVNGELEALKEFLKKTVDVLKPGGRVAVLSYHSLEDRIVKEHFREEEKDCICPPEAPICVCDKESRLNVVLRKPITPRMEEINVNRRARSAKLRVAERK